MVRLDHVPVIYTFNLAGYRPSALPAGERGRYTLGGFTDATFAAMQVLERGAETRTGRSEVQPSTVGMRARIAQLDRIRVDEFS